MTTALSDRQAIDIETVSAASAFLVRKDRKYIVPAGALEALLDDLDPHARVLEIDGRRQFTYESVYYDTPDLRSYRDAAHCRLRRFKVRTRTYLDSGMSLLEVKTRGGRGTTVKHRMPRTFAVLDLHRSEREFVSRHIESTDVTTILRPTLRTSYRRSTIILPDCDGRVTIDSGLWFSDLRSSVLELPDLMIVETKSSGPPTSMDRLLWRHRARPVKISKYGTAMAYFDPDLPSNRWRPVINRYFDMGRVSRRTVDLLTS